MFRSREDQTEGEGEGEGPLWLRERGENIWKWWCRKRLGNFSYDFRDGEKNTSHLHVASSLPVNVLSFLIR